ncbi:MaxF family transcriptional modulator [Lactobacillus helveticus H10]|nr:MaxF family transcriptional modulator [Lactobacillus helveticus H10]
MKDGIMKVNKNFPCQGDIVKIEAEPHAGHEWGGHNPQSGNNERRMLVVSATPYNQQTGFIVAMPITTSSKYEHDKHYKPILISGDRNTGVKGYVCLYQVLNYDYEARNGQIMNHVSMQYLDQIIPYVKAIFDFK